jgi:serine/threonine protein kinase
MSRSFLPDRWDEVGPLLDAALELEPHERRAFVHRACGDDADMRAELENLLTECERSDRLFASGAVERFAALLAEPASRPSEIVAERYRVGREIGIGGMATVYLARDLKHDRDVALKVLRADLSAVLGAERFLAEVRITAKLDHPHILTLIDSGSADGLLFYVLPYVRGESLRAKLTRERQLSLQDALSITRQVAAALDYAHAKGVVHRDVKPENILLHEGEAMLADFGIALAVEEAGGNRLTGIGPSLGTPQYMSPEQATGDHALDSRSDIYSLATVVYEMIAGVPPITGSTKQAIIANLLTERPTKLRVVREMIPEGVDSAVDKALSKAPADRFATAGDFARALDAAVEVPAHRWLSRLILAVLGVAVVALAIMFVRDRIGGTTHAAITLTDRRQLTFSGEVSTPAISSDGRTLAYQTTNCDSTRCTFGIELQDVGSAASRRLFDGASAIYQIEWSPNARNLLFSGTFSGVRGTFLLSALGGTPRRVAHSATFFAGGDSLLSLRPRGYPKDKWVLLSGLDGVPNDSILVGGPTDRVTFVRAVSGSSWIVVGMVLSTVVEARLTARDGRVSSRTMVGHVGTSPEAHTSSDALWVSPGGSRYPKRSILRFGIDAESGAFLSSVDTLFTGVHTGFSVTADGTGLVIDEGSTEFALVGIDVSEAVSGVFPEQNRMVRVTSALTVSLSPNGQRVLVGRDPGAVMEALQSWSTMPFGGGAETALVVAAQIAHATWFDSATAAIRERLPDGSRLALVDVATGALRGAIVISDKYPHTYSHTSSGGWAWVNERGQVSVQFPGDSLRRIPLPAWYIAASGIEASRDGRQVAFVGRKAPNEDSIGVSVISLPDRDVSQWFVGFGEGAEINRLHDDTFLLRLQDTPVTSSLYHLFGPGRAVKLGDIPRMASSVSVSEDLKRAAVVVRNYHGDAWLSRVVRP